MCAHTRVIFQFQSTRPARGATRCATLADMRAQVSIHAPRAGRDLRGYKIRWRAGGFNPRAPRGARLHALDYGQNMDSFNPRAPRGARLTFAARGPRRTSFNPRAPRGARRRSRSGTVSGRSFNPRAPRGARLRLSRGLRVVVGFNPRAPRGARRRLQTTRACCVMFQSTRPARGATGAGNPCPR